MKSPRQRVHDAFREADRRRGTEGLPSCVWRIPADRDPNAEPLHDPICDTMTAAIESAVSEDEAAARVHAPGGAA
jgi:hypothetical protein